MLKKNNYKVNVLVQPRIIHPITEKVIRPPKIIICMRQSSTILDFCFVNVGV